MQGIFLGELTGCADHPLHLAIPSTPLYNPRPYSSSSAVKVGRQVGRFLWGRQSPELGSGSRVYPSHNKSPTPGSYVTNLTIEGPLGSLSAGPAECREYVLQWQRVTFSLGQFPPAWRKWIAGPSFHEAGRPTPASCPDKNYSCISPVSHRQCHPRAAQTSNKKRSVGTRTTKWLLSPTLKNKLCQPLPSLWPVYQHIMR